MHLLSFRNILSGCRRINLQQTITEKLKAMMRDPFLIIPGIFCLIESDIMYQLYM